MNIVQMLLGEHAVLLSACGQLEKLRATADLSQLCEAVRLAEALITQHAIFEDELLFDQMPLLPGNVEDVLKSMRREHDSIPGNFAAVYEAANVLEARQAMERLIEFLREHFALEERVMFPLAARTLGEERLEELGQDWARRRQLASATL